MSVDRVPRARVSPLARRRARSLRAPRLCGEQLETRCLLAQTTGVFVHDAQAESGYVLFSPNTSTNTYLIDKNGAVVNQWHSSYQPGLLAYLLPDGSLLRDSSPHGQGGNGSINAAGAGGLLEKFDWNGNKVWQFAYDSSTHLAHHDFEVMPNGNILLIAWELKTEAQATAAGRDPNLPGAGYLYPDSIVEVHPDYVNGGGTIVWEWHVWDHLVQQFDATKTNYYGPTGVQDHPELINLNYVSSTSDGGGQAEDWTHCNGIDYNATLDQIVLSSREFSEYWIIDHSTTTAQAAGHSGGNSGHGGDLLYRYGNPQAYNRGTAADRVFYYQHDPQWIPAGLPGAGDITVFNNGVGRPGQDFSQVVEITPPVDSSGHYVLAAGAAYGPANATWAYTAPVSDFSAIISGAQRLPNGNTLIDYGVKGTFSEITPTGQEVWRYVSPYANNGTLGPTTPIPNLGLSPPLLDSLYANFAFQAIEYPLDYITPRHVTNVVVKGTGWSPTFVNNLQTAGLGSSVGYAIPVGSSAQDAPLPWSNVNQITIAFSGPVNVQQGSLSVVGVGGQYAFSGFSYDPLNYTATWILAVPIGQDRITLTLKSSAASAVKDPAGLGLDGEWTDGVSHYASGNGVAGGDFVFGFNVLPADANQDGIVNGQDFALVASNWLSPQIAGDANADGIINGQDFAAIASNWLATLPASGDSSGSANADASSSAELQGLLLFAGSARPSLLGDAALPDTRATDLASNSASASVRIPILTRDGRDQRSSGVSASPITGFAPLAHPAVTDDLARHVGRLELLKNASLVDNLLAQYGNDSAPGINRDVRVTAIRQRVGQLTDDRERALNHLQQDNLNFTAEDQGAVTPDVEG